MTAGSINKKRRLSNSEYFYGNILFGHIYHREEFGHRGFGNIACQGQEIR